MQLPPKEMDHNHKESQAQAALKDVRASRCMMWGKEVLPKDSPARQPVGKEFRGSKTDNGSFRPHLWQGGQRALHSSPVRGRVSPGGHDPELPLSCSQPPESATHTWPE